MNHNPILVLNSGNDAAEINMSELVQTRSNGLLLRLEPRARHAIPPRDDVVSARPERISEAYCMLMATPGTSVFHVPSAYRAQVLGFLEEHPQTILDFQAVILTVTPEDKGQRAAADTIDALGHLGANPGQLRVAFLQCDERTSMDSAFKTVRENLQSRSWPNVTFEAKLRATLAFENANKAGIPVSDVLAGEDDYQRAIHEARGVNAAPDVLSQLAHKLLAQRALHGLMPEVDRLLDTLHLPRSAPLEECEPLHESTSLG